MVDKHSNTPYKGQNPKSAISFNTAFLVILSGIIFATFSQYLFENSDSPLKYGSIVVLALYFALAYQPIKIILATPYFATASLITIAIGTAIGTFILQNLPIFDFRTTYGDTGSTILRMLQWHDVFHSWWYVGLFLLMGASLLLSSWRKGFSRSQFPFHLAHLSPLIILSGFLIDYFYGYRGMIDLETGQSTNKVTLYKDNTTYTNGETQMDFSLRLDSFSFANYDPEYRIQLWNIPQPNTSDTVASTKRESPKLIATFPLIENKNYRIYDTDVRFRLAEFYPNFTFEYDYPDNIDTLPIHNPGVLVNLKTAAGEASLQLKENGMGQNKIFDPTSGTSLEFYWEPPDEALKWEKPAIADSIILKNNITTSKVILSGNNRTIYFVKENEIIEKPLLSNESHSLFNKENETFTIQFLFPDSRIITSKPASINDKLENPVARLQVWSKDINPYQTAYLYPGKNKRGSTYRIPEMPYLLALESTKDMQTKFWQSDLTIIDQNDNLVKSSSVKVNEPLKYGAYRFYQSNYDPNNPEYSGIGVSYTPGLNIVYLGFFLMFLGTLLMFYFRNKSGQPFSH